MKQKFQILGVVALISLLPTLLIWLPFFLRLPEFWSIPLPTGGMATIMQNFDGPLYIVVAKTFYNNIQIASNFEFSLPVQYYAAHFPLFPILIWAFGTALNSLFGSAFGFPWGMMLVTVTSSIITLYYFRVFISEHVKPRHLWWVVFVFSIFPARWLITRTVGTPEPLFVGAILASVYHFQKKQYWASGIWGAVAQLTKSPGILLFIGLGLAILVPRLQEVGRKRVITVIKELPWKAYPIALIPLTLLGLFIVYSIQFNDFFAYFNSGDNIHLLFPPFQIFDYSQPWTGTFWLEEIIFVYLIGVLGIVRLYQKKLWVQFYFSLVFFVSIIFVSHRDVIRYSLPIIPFLYVAFSDLIIKREMKVAMVVIIVPIYLFSLAFIANNVMPISDWTPLL